MCPDCDFMCSQDEITQMKESCIVICVIRYSTKSSFEGARKSILVKFMLQVTNHMMIILISKDTWKCTLVRKGLSVINVTSDLRNNDLKIHIEKQTGDKPFRCSYYDKKFFKRGILTACEKSYQGETI